MYKTIFSVGENRIFYLIRIKKRKRKREREGRTRENERGREIKRGEGEREREGTKKWGRKLFSLIIIYV